MLNISDFLRNDTSAAERLAVARKFDSAMRNFGLVTITGHGVESHATMALHGSATEFFSLPLNEKMRFCLRSGYGHGGYVPQGIEAVARSRGEKGKDRPPDLVENIVLARGGPLLQLASKTGVDTDKVTKSSLPPLPATLVKDAQRYWLAMERVLDYIMRLAAVSLDLPEEHFSSPYQNAQCHLRLANYPALCEREGESGEGKDDDAQRYGAHTDYTGFTILRQDPSVSGLEAWVEVSGNAEQGEGNLEQHEERIQGEGVWVPVVPVEGGLVVNAGDLIQVWTNDRWRSPLHRVVKPSGGTGVDNTLHRCGDGDDKRDCDCLSTTPSRLSLVFFTGPSPETLIEALPTCHGPSISSSVASTVSTPPPHRLGHHNEVKRYPPVGASQHLRAKLQASNT